MLDIGIGIDGEISLYTRKEINWITMVFEYNLE